MGLWLRRREILGKEEGARLGERRGIAGRVRPPGPLVWLHAASVGESMSVLPLVTRLRARWPSVGILFTTGTVTSAQLLAERLPSGCFHQYAPLDVPPWVARFLDHWQPGAVLWVESEFWPNTIAEIRRRGLPLALINARLSPRSFQRWRSAAPLLPPPLDAFDPCLAQDVTVATRLAALGAHHVRCLGNLKFDAEPLPADDAELLPIRPALGGRPERLALVVPGHPAGGGEMAGVFAGMGVRVGQRSAGASPGPDTDVYIADTMGELGLFFRLAKIVFMGGSLVPHGGQNALEAARLGCAVILGPHMFNFTEAPPPLLAAGGAQPIAAPPDLPPALSRLFAPAALGPSRAPPPQPA